MSVHQLQLEGIIPSAPSTTRATPTSISAHDTLVAYGSGNNVVVRDISTTGADSILCCWHHTSPVTAVRISPSSKFVASGDQKGNVRLWERRNGTQEKYNGQLLEGPVRDVAWTRDEERLVVVGDGRNNFAAAVTVSGNTIGSINGHTQSILSCDVRGDRPFRAVTGSADNMVGFYEGVPFKFTCNVKEHNEKVMCVRYSPDMETIATVARTGNIILLDGRTGDKKGSISVDHKGSIFSLAWSPDGKLIATASADKTVKVFDVTSASNIATCSTGNRVLDMQQGVAYTARGVVSVSFGGKLTLINEKGEMTRTFLGHQGRILLLHKESDELMVSVSVDRALIWRGTAAAAAGEASEVPLSADLITAAAFSGGKLYIVAGSELLRYDPNDSTPAVVSQDVTAVTALTVTEDGTAVLLLRNSFIVISSAGSKIAEEKLDRFDGCSAAARGQMIIVGGEKLVKGYQITESAPPEAKVQFAGHHTGAVACLAFSHDGQVVASGDANRNIFVWSWEDGSILHKDLVFHTLRVTSLSFAYNSNTRLLSGSMDASLILWDLEAKTRRMEDAAHRGGVSAVFGAADGTLISGGSDGCIRLWKSNN